jgi:predicted transcriptional regulator of viral defense system
MNLHLYIKELRKSGKYWFSIEDVIAHFKVSRNYARVSLHRLLQSGDLVSPLAGLYVIIPPEHQVYGSIPAEELVPIIMGYLNADYYVALLSAAAFHGATHQKPAKFQVISDRRIKHKLVFGEVEIDLVYKKSLSDLPTQNFAVRTGYLRLATPELVAIDLLNYPARVGGLNHIATVLSELVENLDASKLVQLAQDMKAEHQLQRIGYILEKIDVMDDEKKENIIEAILGFLSANKKDYRKLASEITKVGYPRCKRWKIIENTEIESDL